MESEAPGGVRAFLFTDIAGSSRRWEDDRRAMAAGLARHDELLRAAVADHGGRVFKHTGDGMCAVFAGPGPALRAAVAGQRRLRSEPWETAEPLAVRMAVHVGTAEEREGDYFGPTLNRIARLLDLGHGGQVLATEACRALLAEEPSAVELVELGEYRLRDLGRPERVFQVGHPDLPASFPPLRSSHAVRSSLPLMPSAFVGRRRELDEIARLLAASRLVTLVGPGGAGKTRLALEAAAGAVDAFADGVFFVDLAPLTEAAQLVSRVVASLGMVVDAIEGDFSEGGRRRLIEYLRGRQALVVLDNCEHLLDEAARLADDALRSCPRLGLMATSREALRVPGESAWVVPPLSLPPVDGDGAEEAGASDAVALFCERAVAIDAGFRLGPDNAAAVARICRRLDGIPLALELAAARLRVLSAEELAERLDDRFRLLTGGARTAAPRHQTLRAALDWGADLLTEAERALLRRLAAFRGRFELEAAEAVGADGAVIVPLDVLDLLGRLVDKSWISVERDRTSHYRCSETIRQYAEEQLEASGEAEDTRRRHCRFYLGLVTEKRAALVYAGEWVARLRAADDNLRVAIEWALSAGEDVAALRMAAGLFNYWYLSGQVLEGVAWLERVLAVSTSMRRPARVGALNGLGYLRRQLGDRDGVLPLHEEARLLALEIGDPLGEAMSLMVPAPLNMERGEFAEAQTRLEMSQRILEGHGMAELATWADHDLGWVELARGNVAAADRLFRRVLDSERPGFGGVEGSLTGTALAALALTAALRGDAPGARTVGAEAIEAARDLELPQVLVMALTRVSESAVVLAEHDRAGHLLAESLQVLGRCGGRAWVATSLELAAVVLSAAAPGRPAAVRLLGAAEACREATGESFRWPHLQVQVTACVDSAQATLDRETFAGAWDRGRRLDVGDAVALAAAELAQGAADRDP